ncbi:MAG: hypothetical protein ACK587_13795 [Cyanobacteriota bacterium]
MDRPAAAVVEPTSEKATRDFEPTAPGELAIHLPTPRHRQPRHQHHLAALGRLHGRAP